MMIKYAFTTQYRLSKECHRRKGPKKDNTENSVKHVNRLLKDSLNKKTHQMEFWMVQI